MLERHERPEKQDETPNTSERNLHRNFRPVDKPSTELQQLTGPQENVSARGDWVDTGFHIVPVDKISMEDNYVRGPSDFKKASYAEMVRGFKTLESEVRPAVEKGAGVDHFRNLDLQRGLNYSRGSQRIYEAFYGQEPIRLNRIGDRYEVVNGYHRLYVAKEMGLSTVPARVIEKKT